MMFVSEKVTEWGGVMVELNDGRNTSSITFTKDPAVLKITAPNRKGSFDLKKVAFLMYRSVSSDRGAVIVGFTSDVTGVDNREYHVGEMAATHWRVLKDNVSRLVRIVEE